MDTFSFEWGMICGPFVPGECGWAISHLSISIFYCAGYFSSSWKDSRGDCGTHVMVQTDRSMVMHSQNRSGGTRSNSLDLKVWKIIQWYPWYLRSRISVAEVRIAGPNNVEVDFRYLAAGYLYSRPIHHSARTTRSRHSILDSQTLSYCWATLSRQIGPRVCCGCMPLCPLLSLALRKVMWMDAQITAILPGCRWFPLVLQPAACNSLWTYQFSHHCATVFSSDQTDGCCHPARSQGRQLSRSSTLTLHTFPCALFFSLARQQSASDGWTAPIPK